MTSHQDVIAWLVPTARGTSSDKATQMPENMSRTIDISSSSTSPYLTSHISNLSTATICRPERALQLTFDQPLKRRGRIVLGTDARTCDLSLPRVAGVDGQHCTISFDSQSRLVLQDTSTRGTQVWYGSESSGDKTNHIWVLSGSTQRVTIDIQGLRFHIVVNEYPGKDPVAYQAKVDEFSLQPPWADLITPDWDRASVDPVLPLFTSQPLFRHIFVKGVVHDEGRGELYLWNMARPWEPMVKA
ncbi:FHA domain [Geosmithia morbida]|uniref:FHA domain n=1 Tax=Geosmithia morbida TaxID=1094350 RepID=A0A9P5D329_9HYPO|nr:FHA domain [Geosmithia morbida]KAF4120079.1 FHA domain [Geosmithia morbida]